VVNTTAESMMIPSVRAVSRSSPHERTPVRIVGAKIDDADGRLISRRSSSEPHLKKRYPQKDFTGATNSSKSP